MTAPSEPLRVFLPGWSFAGPVVTTTPLAELGSWHWPPPGLAAARWPGWLAQLLARRPDRSLCLVGWSLGATVALRCYRLFAPRVATLALLALRSAWPPQDLAAITAGLRESPAAFLADFHRKALLGCRPPTLPAVVVDAPSLARLEADLWLLAATAAEVRAFSHRSGHDPSRVVVLHGERDVIVPPSAAADLPGAPTRFLRAGHGLPWSPRVAEVVAGQG